jgi:hypothetical protein
LLWQILPPQPSYFSPKPNRLPSQSALARLYGHVRGEGQTFLANSDLHGLRKAGAAAQKTIFGHARMTLIRVTPRRKSLT